MYDDYSVLLNAKILRVPLDPSLWFTQEYFNASGEFTYRPLTTLSYWIDVHLYGFNPWTLHLVNLLWHLGACVLVWSLLTRLGFGEIPAFVGTLLFGVHPLPSEAVMCVTYRKDLLMVAGVLAAVRLALAGRHGWAYLVGALALLSKESALVLPLLVGFVLAADQQAGTFDSVLRFWKKPWLGYWLVISAYVLLRFGWMSHHADTLPPYPGGSLVTALGTGLWVWVHYLRSFFWPVALSPVHEFEAVVGLSDWRLWAALGLAGLGLGGVLRARSRNLRLQAGLLWLGAGLVPALGLYPVANPGAERFFYLPMFGAVMLVAEFCGWLVAALKAHRIWRKVAGGVALIAFAGFSFLTVRQSGVWADDLALWSAAYYHYPQSPKSQFGLGWALYQAGDSYAAKKRLDSLLRVSPWHPQALLGRATLHLQEKEFGRALDLYAQLLRVQPENAGAWLGRGKALEGLGRRAEARSAYEQGLEFAPGGAELFVAIGDLLKEAGDWKGAQAQYYRAVSANPAFAYSYNKLGIIQAAYVRDPVAAQGFFEKAVEVQPGSLAAREAMENLKRLEGLGHATD
ncbi:MAG: tetratricopeptide repeat protein [Candidatus Omnitrophica bacterium]|nr:tetratricopeptide repeat protein [Candidatus Omnitrophota bacterium]